MSHNETQKFYQMVKDNPNDKETVLTAIKNAPFTFQYASESLRKDKEVILSAVQREGQNLCFSLIQDKEIVLAAVQQHGHALRFALPKFTKDKEIVLAAIKTNFTAHKYMDAKLKTNSKFTKEITTLFPQLAYHYPTAL